MGKLRIRDAVLLMLIALLVAVFVGLGTWQVQRLGWKLDLIAQVEARAYGAPVAAPLGDVLPYSRVTTAGVFLNEKSLRIKAVTDLGPGFWIMTPLKTDTRSIWVNRGFVPTGMSPQEVQIPSGPQKVTGLVRASVPHGTWLEKNDPAADRWYSADLPVMSAQVNLTDVAPYYIDVERRSEAVVWPRGGMAQLQFRNTHLVYAVTWYALAVLLAGAVAFIIRERRKGALDLDEG